MRRSSWSTLPAMAFVKRGLVVALVASTALAQPTEDIVVGPQPMVVLPPPLVRRLNWEPFLLTGAGAIMLGLGTWRLIAAENTFQQLRAFAPLPQESSAAAIERAHNLGEAGKFDTGVGWGLIGAGAAAVGGSLLWLFVEGVEKEPFVFVLPTPTGGALSWGGRF